MTLVADGQQLDLRSWDERFGRPEEEQQPASLDGLVSRWLAEGEHEQLEYKLELKENQTRVSFAETVAAFANGTGGTILVGVEDDGTRVGYAGSKGADQITNIIGNLVSKLPQFTVREARVENRLILVVSVRPSPLHAKPPSGQGTRDAPHLGHYPSRDTSATQTDNGRLSETSRRRVSVDSDRRRRRWRDYLNTTDVAGLDGLY